MKLLKQTTFIISVLFLLSSFTKIEDKSYVGKWKGEDKGDIGFLILSKEGYATFEFEGQAMGGKSYNHKGIEASMKYIVNTSSKPYAIDFIITNLSNDEELGRLIGIIEMNDKSTMKMALTFGGGSERPSDFSQDAITFNRFKE
ncbi:hypothetical protein ACFQ1Q_11880 [Winogradskyella litorisediminis]|uniref:DUF4488 domain-containing protein n=1 Tax=Winogradskyella litorisediminis TaxID=1156618 RepID=A0ABW3N8J4_9FLAO